MLLDNYVCDYLRCIKIERGLSPRTVKAYQADLHYLLRWIKE